MSDNGTVRIAGCWENGWITPIKEMDLWEMILRDFQVEDFSMMPVSGIAGAIVKEYHNIEEILAANTDVVPVYIDEKGTSDLVDFVHPENALYIFGKVSFAPYNVYANENSQSVRITTKANDGLLWPHQAATIVLYDRMIKTR